MSPFELASIIGVTPEIDLTPYQLRIIDVIRSRGGSHTGPQLEGDCAIRPGLTLEEMRWRKSRSVFYSNLHALCEVGKIERFSLMHYIGVKKDRIGYRVKE